MIPGRLVIASRGSRLAVTQAEMVAGLVRRAHPHIDIEIRKVSTKGDKDARPFASIGGKGLFTTEVEREVVEGNADVAVHSAKDLTAELGDGCTIVCVPRRASVHDVVVGGEGPSGEQRLAGLSAGATVGTSSMRRRALLAESRPDVDIVDFRGNLDSRLAKVDRGEVDAAILAAAGIERLGGDGGAGSARLDPAGWVPAPAQGALAVEALGERADLASLFEGLIDPLSAAALACERAFAARLEGGCSVPLGCLAVPSGDRLVVTGFLGLPDGTETLRDRISGGVSEASALGVELAEALLAAGGKDILEEIRASSVSAPSAP